MTPGEIIRTIGRALADYSPLTPLSYIEQPANPQVSATLQAQLEQDQLKRAVLPLQIEHKRHEKELEDILMGHESRMSTIMNAFAIRQEHSFKEHHEWMDDWLDRFHKIINDSDLPVVEPTPKPSPPSPGTMYEPEDHVDIPF